MNGFELWRQVSRAKDPIRKDVDFHLKLAIQTMGRTCENSFDGTYSRLLELEKARKNYKQTTGGSLSYGSSQPGLVRARRRRDHGHVGQGGGMQGWRLRVDARVDVSQVGRAGWQDDG